MYDCSSVAAILTPTISSGVETAVSQGIAQFRKELGAQLHRIQKTDQRVSFLEEEIQQTAKDIHTHEQALQFPKDKIDDFGKKI